METLQLLPISFFECRGLYYHADVMQRTIISLLYEIPGSLESEELVMIGEFHPVQVVASLNKISVDIIRSFLVLTEQKRIGDGSGSVADNGIYRGDRLLKMN